MAIQKTMFRHPELLLRDDKGTLEADGTCEYASGMTGRATQQAVQAMQAALMVAGFAATITTTPWGS